MHLPNVLKKNKLISKIYNNIFRKTYYYVPPCPNCKSKLTGRYLKDSGREYNNDWTINEALRHGEIVRFGPMDRENMAFCLACDYEWKEYVSLRLIKPDELAKEKRDRMTEELLHERLHPSDENGNPIPQKKKRFFSFINPRNFMGE